MGDREEDGANLGSLRRTLQEDDIQRDENGARV